MPGDPIPPPGAHAFNRSHLEFSDDGVVSATTPAISVSSLSQVHLGTKNVDFQMERYTFKRRADGKLSP